MPLISSDYKQDAEFQAKMSGRCIILSAFKNATHNYKQKTSEKYVYVTGKSSMRFIEGDWPAANGVQNCRFVFAF